MFASMVNDFMRSWGLRVKFVDYSTTMEILPRNSLFVLNFLVNDIQSFANHNNMRLNPGMSITVSFLQYNRYLAPPVEMGGAIIEDVLSVFQVARVNLFDDLSCEVHCDCLLKKANRRLFALRQHRRSTVPAKDIVYIYRYLIQLTDLFVKRVRVSAEA